MEREDENDRGACVDVVVVVEVCRAVRRRASLVRRCVERVGV